MQSAQNKLWIIYMTDFQAATESLHAMGGCGGGWYIPDLQFFMAYGHNQQLNIAHRTLANYNSLWPPAIISNRKSTIYNSLWPTAIIDNRTSTIYNS